MSGEDLQDLQLDVRGLAVGPQGVEGFRWPLGRHESGDYAAAFLKSYVEIVNGCGLGEAQTVPYKILAKYIVSDAAGLFQADLLKHRCAERKLRPLAPPDWQVWPPMFAGRAPARPNFLDYFRDPCVSKNASARKPSLLSRLRRAAGLLKFRKEGLVVDGMKVGPLTARALKEAVVATQRTHLIAEHAAMEEREVYFCRSGRWFSAVEPGDLARSLAQKPAALEAALIDAARAGYEAAGLRMAPHVRDFLEGYLSEGAAALRVHYGRLLAKKESLPRHVWTGSGGDTYDMLLRLAAIEAGGTAEGHEHGAGSAHIDMKMIGVVELWGCDRYNVYNKSQAALMTANAARWPLFGGRAPEIVGLRETPDLSRLRDFPRFRTKNPGIKTVVLLGTIYDRDRGRIVTLTPDTVYVDWQARLIAALKSWGYEVIFKPHPECVVPPPAAFGAMGAEIASGNFEDMMQRGDLLLFDCIYTTTFQSALESNIPVVVADLENIPWTAQAKELLDRRCAFVYGGYDENNRLQVNWEEMKAALEDAPALCNNQDFVRRYYL